MTRHTDAVLINQIMPAVPKGKRHERRRAHRLSRFLNSRRINAEQGQKVAVVVGSSSIEYWKVYNKRKLQLPVISTRRESTLFRV